MAEVPLDAIQPFDRPAALARDQKLRNSACDHTSCIGSARWAGRVLSPSSGMGSASQTCSGEAPHARAAAHRLEIGQGILAALQREVPRSPTSRGQPPPDALPVEWAPVGVLAVAVAVVAM